MNVSFALVGGPGDGRIIDFCSEYPPRFDQNCWDDFVEPLWARYVPVHEDDSPPRIYRFHGFVNGKWPSAWMWNYEC